MGRSVSFPRGAIVCFEDISGFNEDSEEHWDFDWFVDDLIVQSSILFPSLYRCDQWRGREDHILMRNAYADFGVSAYGCLAAIWIAERVDNAYYDYPREARAHQWLKQIRPKFVDTFGTHLLDGYMSNGEGVFRRKPQKHAAQLAA